MKMTPRVYAFRYKKQKISAFFLECNYRECNEL